MIKPPPPPPRLPNPPIAEASVESCNEILARHLHLPVGEVENAMAFRAEVDQKISGLPGLLRSGWDELPARTGFAQILGSADRATIESLDELGIRVIDGFVYTLDERRARVRAVSTYLSRNDFKFATVGHAGDQVLVKLAESQHRRVETSDLVDALVPVASAAVGGKELSDTSNDHVIIRSIPDARIPKKRPRKL